jgi:hypothetical protein
VLQKLGGCAKQNPIGPINAPVSRGPQRSLVPGRSPGIPKVPGTMPMTGVFSSKAPCLISCTIYEKVIF